jgi:uncharacterized protein YciI
MAYFALMYELVDDYLTRRSQFREQHLKMANDLKARGEIVLAGAFADPPDKALLVFDTDDRSVPESFAKHDPYVINGLVKRWEVRAWSVVVGNPT